MEITVPIVTKDPEVTDYKVVPPTEMVKVVEDVFLDGPVSPRVAVLDFDEITGVLHPGTTFQPHGAGGQYVVTVPTDLQMAQLKHDRAFIRASTFGTVYKTLQMWEEPDGLGRPVVWAFAGPQLLVVPCAGEWRNAFYQRESRSLQFFFFQTAASAPRIFTALSQDIVAHETAHAVLDGLAPDLYDSTLPESLALHEAVADLTAALCSFRSHDLARRVLEQTGGEIARSSAFNGLAEQFGSALGDGRLFLRDLLNEKRLADVDRSEPHALSEVLSGAIYKSIVELHAQLRREYERKDAVDPDLAVESEARHAQRSYETQQAIQSSPSPARVSAGAMDRLGAAEKALWVTGKRLQRLLYRGLDYLPPGEVTFSDFARAMLAADRASHPDSDRHRRTLEKELVARGIVESLDELATPVSFNPKELTPEMVAGLAESDWLAYDFVNRHRAELGTPEGAFQVQPRLVVTKLDFHRDGRQSTVKECLFKIGWTVVEDNDVGEGLPARRRYTAGLTMAFDMEKGGVRAQLASAGGRTEVPRQARTEFIRRLVEDDLLRVGPESKGVNGKPVTTAPRAEVSGDVLRVRATACMLHLVEERRG